MYNIAVSKPEVLVMLVIIMCQIAYIQKFGKFHINGVVASKEDPTEFNAFTPLQSTWIHFECTQSTTIPWQ